MKSNKITFVAMAVVVVLLVVYLFTFQVRANEVAVHYRRGVIHRIINMDKDEAGWKFQLRPFDRVVKYDKRVRVLEGPAVEMQLKDERQIVIGMYAAWQIADPSQFVKSLKSEDEAAGKLKDIIYDETSTRIGSADFKHLVNANQEELRFDQIKTDIAEAVSLAVGERGYGVKVVSLGVRQMAIPPLETSGVLEGMREERKARAAEYTAQGLSERDVIRSKALREADAIRGQAALEAERIKAQAEKDASVYYDEFAKEPELAIFLADMKSLTTIARNATRAGTPLTLVLDMSTIPYRWLMTGPDGDQAKGRAEGAPVDAGQERED
ncbi:MAG: SPFH domain-containing protein [Candidatus Brocadiia bacterium]|nr:SPFH domain-containing protein [Candidatus Brocadiia bacterium]